MKKERIVGWVLAIVTLVVVILSAGFLEAYDRQEKSSELRELRTQVEYLHALVEEQDERLDHHKKHIKVLEEECLPECGPFENPLEDKCHKAKL